MWNIVECRATLLCGIQSCRLLVEKLNLQNKCWKDSLLAPCVYKAFNFYISITNSTSFNTLYMVHGSES